MGISQISVLGRRVSKFQKDRSRHEDIWVDVFTGNVTVIDLGYAEKLGANLERLNQAYAGNLHSVEPGFHRVWVRVYGDERHYECHDMDFRSGKAFIGDAGDLFYGDQEESQWRSFLKATKRMKRYEAYQGYSLSVPDRECAVSVIFTKYLP